MWPSIRDDAGSAARFRVAVVPASAHTSAPADRHTDNPVARVEASVRSGLRGGRLLGVADTSRIGDIIYLSCTPRDANGDPTDAHGPIQAWFVSGDATHALTDTGTFHADLHAQGPGEVSVACRVDDITSPAVRVSIHP